MSDRDPLQTRDREAGADDLFVARWSPRAFDTRPVDPDDLAAIFEAARWSPSCFNEQPWLFVYARDGEDRERMLGLLVDGNREWADRAPVVGIVFAKKSFARNGDPNRWGPFDAGAASLAVALQASLRGLVSHFMGGIHADRCCAELGVPEQDWEPMAGFAIGHPGDPAVLSDALREREAPSGRKPLAEVAMEGRYRAPDGN